MTFVEIAIFYIVRILSVSLVFYLGYLFVNHVITPKIFEPNCLTDTDSCTTMDIYLYKNTFVAQEKISQIWFWYNGFYLYIYGQAAGTCNTNFDPVNVFTMTLKDGNLVFTPFPDNCISSLDTVIDSYTNLGVSKQTIYMRPSEEVAI
jgi:hypothetical protein